MAKTCTVCRHKNRAAIEVALVNGEPLRTIAQRTQLSRNALQYHKLTHLPETLTKAKAAREIANADDLMSQIFDLQARSQKRSVEAENILVKAKKDRDDRLVLAAIREGNGCNRELVRLLVLLAEMEGKLSRIPQVNVLLAPEWLEMRTAIVIALEPYPEARLAVANAMEAIEDSSKRLEAGA